VLPESLRFVEGGSNHGCRMGVGVVIDFENEEVDDLQPKNQFVFICKGHICVSSSYQKRHEYSLSTGDYKGHGSHSESQSNSCMQCAMLVVMG
jgi:hypothetical protein